jgi:hypothetical protein
VGDCILSVNTEEDNLSTTETHQSGRTKPQMADASVSTAANLHAIQSQQKGKKRTAEDEAVESDSADDSEQPHAKKVRLFSLCPPILRAQADTDDSPSRLLSTSRKGSGPQRCA